MTDLDNLASLRNRLIRYRRDTARNWNREDPLDVAERLQKLQSLVNAVEETIRHERLLGAAQEGSAPTGHITISQTARANSGEAASAGAHLGP